ncbi:hypothetical protein BBI00_15755 [Chryseobacterium arthrosphaerae]|uniref:Uncharacterized protein n=1 Tax=Chryseobacterium arthrosphaerae TaxID=651561 RepID=A0A1B8ZI04_9FLAO|nr:hypothetical protein BBI00_15755 [Chryseobacterium arthrosphaerae]
MKGEAGRGASVIEIYLVLSSRKNAKPARRFYMRTFYFSIARAFHSARGTDNIQDGKVKFRLLERNGNAKTAGKFYKRALYFLIARAFHSAKRGLL